MSGKPYTIQEFKMIVDYLVENKLYGEIKARKMWVDFANTKLTTRTWQSLKETFLKRVLPDIHNPYFHLTNEQISSFRARCDLADRNKNKLDIRPASGDTSDGPKDYEPSHNEEETTAGENIKCSKVPVRSRSSADTVILENCYENAEEIQKDLESNGSDDKPTGASKSLRDCITYSEPLTPMLQEVLDDFASEPEDSDREGQMEIDENLPEDNQEVPGSNNEVLISKSKTTDVAKNANGTSSKVVEAQKLDDGSKPVNSSPKENNPNEMNNTDELPVANINDEISSMQAENGTERDDDAEGLEVEKNGTAEVTEKPVAQNSETLDEVIIIHDSNSEPQVQSGGLNNSNNTVDASLPNNPEALKNKNSKTANNSTVDASLPNNPEALKNKKSKTANNNEAESVIEEKTSKNPKRAPRKRSSSEDNTCTIDNKKKKFDLRLKSPAKKHNKVTKSHLDPNIVKLSATKEPLEPDVIDNPLPEDKVIDLASPNKPSTSSGTGVVGITETEKTSNTKDIPEIKNPCLQNISLFDEQFNKTNYTLSESSDTEQNKKESQADKQAASVLKPSNARVVLRSNSDSDTEVVHTVPQKKQRAGVLISKTEREKAIANMFGFTSGGVGAKRKRQLNRRSRTLSHNYTSHNNASHHTAAPFPASNSSDWTSESEEFVSPPRSRKNRPTRKYLKPHAVKISALEEEGGLFVMYGKKIYPVIKDGKIVKNYITYLPESDSEEDETFWKQKYEEEKQKALEFKKLLEEAKVPQQSINTDPPIQQANSNRNSRRPSIAVEPSNSVAKETSVPAPAVPKQKVKEGPEIIKIKFTKNNEEVQLEGHWPQIHPVLEQVVHIFHKEVRMAIIPESSLKAMAPAVSKEMSSGTSTPVIIPDPEVHAKVNEIEKEIFKEIEELDKEEEVIPKEEATNVTKRKMGPPPSRKSSLASAHSPEEQPKTTNGPDTRVSEGNSRTRKQKAKETENNNNNTEDLVSKRPTRMPRKILNDTVDLNQSKTMKTRRSTQKLNTSSNDQESEVRYMLPPRTRSQSSKSPANKKTNQKKSSKNLSKIGSSPDSVSLNSNDSTQGYQDTDGSPVNTETKRKKKIDTSSFVIKTRNSLRRSARRKTHPYLYHDAYNDSSNSSVDASILVVSRENSSANTDAFRSESYQLLNPRAKVSSRQLEPIDETSPINNETYFVRHFESTCGNEKSAEISLNVASPSCQMTNDVGSSSSISLPMSPELSIVENMSISKELLHSVEDYPTINELQSNDLKEVTVTMRSKYNMISDVDVSVPLMNQECEFESCNTVVEMSIDPKSLLTESLLKSIDTFNINDQVTATDTLNKKLHALLLDSAKKTTEVSAPKEASMMDVDVTNVEVQKKPRANRKRCSTPQKRKGSKKSVTPTVDTVLEEEHVESFSHSGRKSCPPSLQISLCNENVVTEEINMANLTIANVKPKGRKKKDIIRVKIQRPKNKKGTEKIRAKSAQNGSKISVCTDSGINDSASEIFLVANDSVDLIHNHSETCLNANECVGDSIEFVDNSLKSVVTLGDSMESGDNAWNSLCVKNEEHSTSPDLFCNNAQDVSLYNRANAEINNSRDTVYHSPPGTEVSPSSLITEDLSDDAPPPPPARSSKWYLFSEDETNTNLVGSGSTMLSSGYYGSNLKQLFPVACAVPDLSTITEMSKENDSSRKPTLEDLEGLTGEDFNSLSVFHSNL